MKEGQKKKQGHESRERVNNNKEQMNTKKREKTRTSPIASCLSISAHIRVRKIHGSCTFCTISEATLPQAIVPADNGHIKDRLKLA